MMVDLLQVEQVLLNLLRNAIEAISERERGGLVTIQATRLDRDEVGFEIRDTGPGFPADFATAEFPPFSSTKSEGLGVGLSLCRSIIESHGGKFQIGGGREGAVVRFTLPVAEPARA